ncbi:MAG TPA: hypothetical protein VD887_12495 [Allosphingosinicella sp.]|nr:hypothetical protein [Allosphingosinicella sp.]
MIAVLTSLLLAAVQSQPPETDCTARVAVRADIRHMAREPERWLGRCVRLDGYVDYNRFYSDVGGYYRYFATNYDDTRNFGWMGLYPVRRYGFRGPMRRGSVFGIVHDCETDHARAQARSPDSIVMMTGFCHYRYGLVLRRVWFRPEARADFERQMGEEPRRGFGDLESTSEAGPLPAEVRILFDRFLAAVRAGDEETLRGLAVLRYGDEPDERTRAATQRAFLLGEDGSPFASLRAARETPPVAFFRERRSRHAPPAEGWHACFCKTEDCSGLWPISAEDASADPIRPYVCVRAFGYDYRRPPDRISIVPQSGYPLEPRRTAFRRRPESSRR